MPTLPLTPIVRLPGRGNRYQVTRGAGHGTYLCDADAGTCNCRGWLYRHDCCHVRLLFDHLQRERACPGCQGLGIVALRSRYVGTTPIPCALCDGTGLRLTAETQVAAMSNTQLLELFR